MMEKESCAGREDFFEQCLEALHEKDRLSFAGKFVQGFVHNANGPLQNLSMLTEMLLVGTDLQDRMFRAGAGDDPKWAELVEKQKKRITQVRDQVFALARDMSEFMHLHEIERSGTDIDINALLTRIHHIFRADLFFKHRVQSELRLAKNLPVVHIRGRALVPAILHLIENAITAVKGSARKEISIETGLYAGSLEIRITDSGCGLCGCEEPESLFGIFESKWPEGGEESRKAHFGFGLYAARRLLAPYGGSVSLECGVEGASSVIRIPLTK